MDDIKRALVLVQGINAKNGYLKRDLKKSNFDYESYDLVTQVKTEEVFDDSFLSKMPLIGDKFGDILQYFKNEEQRKKVSRRVTKKVKALRKKGYEVVDLLAHSLGTVISLTSKAEIDTMISMGSPLSMTGLGWYVRRHTKKYLNAKIKKLYYVYSPKDFVCRYFNDAVKKLLKKFKPKAIKSTSRHDAIDYINDFLVHLPIFHLS